MHTLMIMIQQIYYKNTLRQSRKFEYRLGTDDIQNFC